MSAMCHVKIDFGGRMVPSETTLFLRQDPHALALLAEAASDDFQQYLTGVRYQRDAPVVAALCPILFFMEYHKLQIQTTISSSLQRRARSPLRVILNNSKETPSGPTAFPFANERMAPVSSCVVG